MHFRHSTTPRPAYGAAPSLRAAMLFGVGLACCGSAWSSQAPAEDGLGTLIARLTVATPRADPSTSASQGDRMDGWKPVTHERLDELRGGFEMAGLQVSFGIERAVYVNGNLVVQTSLMIPDVSRITTEQAARLASALQTAGAAGDVGRAAANSGLAAAGIGGAGQGSGAASGSNGSATGAPGTASASAGAGAAVGSPGTATATAGSASASGGAGSVAMPAPAVIATGTGSVTTNGLLSLIQNGPGNSVAGSAATGAPATIIQNTLNNQSIQSLMMIDASVNTLQAFRAQVINGALDSALRRAASTR